MLRTLIGVPLGFAFANGTEWFAHKYVLHGLGRDRESFWAFHWHDHHRACRKHGHYDADYAASVLQDNGQGREVLGLVALALAVAPAAALSPSFVLTTYYCALNYYFKHRRAHLDPDWAREHLPWHYDHHMGPNQDANWCVTRPWFDHLMGTRERYVGTEREERARPKHVARAQAARYPDEHAAV